MRKAWMLASTLALACGGPDKPVQGGTVPITTVFSAAPSGSGDLGTTAPAMSANTTKGLAALQAKDFQTAKAYFDKALKDNPRDADALAFTGIADDELGDKAGAEKAYKDALKIRPDLVEAVRNLGLLYVDAQKWDEAIALLKPAVQKQADATLHEGYAQALAGKGDQAGATSEYEAALKQSPNDAMLLWTYGHQLAVWQQTEPALSRLRLARGATTDGDLLAQIGHDFLLLKAVGDCVPTFDKAIGVKDGAASRTERGLCKLAGKDLAGAQTDFQWAVDHEATYKLAHYWLGFALLNAKKTTEGVKELEWYVKNDPTGAKVKQAQDLITKAKGKK